MNDETIKLILDMGKSGKNVDEVREAVEKLEGKLEAVPASANKAAGGIGNMGQAALQGSRALQDFTQGGLAGVLNNIEGVVQALGGSAGLTGVLTGVGVAAYIALPKIREWFDAVTKGSNEVPKATDALERLNDELKDNAKRLDELRKNQTLTNQELREFNKLTERQAELEEKAKAAREKEAEAREVGGLKPFGEKEAAGERSEAMKALLGGEPDRKKLLDQMTKGIEAEFDAANKTPGEAGAKRARAISKLVTGEIGSFNPALSHEQNVRNAAESIMNRAITKGGEADIRTMTRFLPPGSQMRSRIEESALPENLKRQEKEIADEAEHFGKVSVANKARHAHERRMRREGEIHHRIQGQMEEHDDRERKAADHRRQQADDKAIQADVRLGRKIGEAAIGGPRVGHLDKAEMMPFEPMPGMGGMEGGGGGMPMGGGMGTGMGGDGMPQMGVQGMAGPGMGMMGVHNAQLQAMHGMMGVVDMSHSNQQALIGRYRALASFAETQRQNMVYTRQRMMPMGNYGW